jgi:hypothetical protein
MTSSYFEVFQNLMRKLLRFFQIIFEIIFDSFDKLLKFKKCNFETSIESSNNLCFIIIYMRI